MTQEWRLRAACRNHNPDWWHPHDRGNSRAAQTALNICKTQCTVTAECLEYALRTVEVHGIWGGTTEKKRAAMIRNHRHPATGDHGTERSYQRHLRRAQTPCQRCISGHQSYLQAMARHERSVTA